ncbi:MAG: MATE family efflux transporter [Ruminococcus sp.]|nr:MATE family efflux transporter [Ruminococcus sp.]
MKNKDLTVGSPSKVLIAFCLPMFASVIFQQLYNLADSFVAGRFLGEDMLAAVGNGYEVTLIFLAFGFGINIGCSVICSQLFGAKKLNDLKCAVYTTFISTAVLSVLLTLLGEIFTKPLLELINTPESIMWQSQLYLYIYIGGLPFVFFYNVSNGIFSALGDSKTPFVFLACSSIANIGMDVLFVLLFPKWGTATVAWATFICQGISCVLAVIFVFRRLKTIETQGRVKVFSFGMLKRISVIAIPSILQQSFISVGNIVIQGIINSFGTAVVAGYSASVKLNNLVITSMITVGNGISNYTAQNLGAQKTERIKKGFKSGLMIVWLIAIPFALVYFFFGDGLSALFMKAPTEEALSSARVFLRIVSPFYVMVAMKLTADGVLRGLSKMGFFMAATFTDLVLRVGLSFVLSRFFADTGIWLSWPIGWGVATIMSVSFYFISVRKKNKIIKE